jgi:hypothetical protein
MINLSYYAKQLELVELQFELVRFALNAPSVSKNFFSLKRKKLLAEVDGFHKQTLELIRETPNIEPVMEIVEKHFEKSKREDMRKIRRQFKSANIRTYEEIVADTLNQSELLLLVAHFESFLKDYHKELLFVSPEKVFGCTNNNRSVFLRDVFTTGFEYLRSSKFLKGEVEREVKELDRQNVETKINYFKKFYGIEICDLKDNEKLEEISDLRNNISHHFSNPRKITFVNNKTIENAMELCSRIPCHACKIAKEKFPRFQVSDE